MDRLMGTVNLLCGRGGSGLSFALVARRFQWDTCPRSRSGGGRGHPGDLVPDREAVGAKPAASHQAVAFANFYDTLRARFSNPDLDLPTIRDVLETMHLATKEPEGVSYAEVDAGGVEALWCIPAGSDPERLLLHSHMGGTVVTSMHSDRKAAAHIAKAAGV